MSTFRAVRVRLPIAWLDAWPRTPAVPIAIAMGAGVAAGRLALPVLPCIWLAASAILVALAIAMYRNPRRCSIGLILATSFASMAMTQLVTFRYPADHITQFVGDDRRLCFLRLYLPNEPRIRFAIIGGRPVERQATIAQVSHVRTRDGAWTPATGDVLLTLSQTINDLHAGQTVELVGFIERPGIAMNPGQFDWQRYYRSMGVLNSVNVPKRDNVRILDKSPAPLLTRWREHVRQLFDQGFTKDQSLDHKLMSALLLGDYDPELRDVKEDFRKTGTSHHLAISGMHIAVVGGLAFFLCRLFGFGPRSCWTVALIVVLLYGAAATPSPPVLRAVILFGVAGAAFLIARFSGAIQTLSLTVAVMLAWQPSDLFNAGFQLSFGTVLGLVLLSDPMARRWSREDEEQILLPEEIERLPITRKLRRWTDRATLRLLAAGVVAWLVSMPLIAAQFEQLNPWQVATSIALGPLVMLSLLTGVLKVVGTALVPGSPAILASMAAATSRWMRELVGWMATWPYGDVPLTAPPPWLVGMCWVALGIAVVKWRMTVARFAAIGLLVITFGYMLIGPYWFGSPTSLRAGDTRITLMSVGAGQCALVETGAGRIAMFDCGSASLTDLTANVVKPLLRTRGISHLDTMLISHANTDHYSHVAEVAGAYGAHEVMTADGFEADARTTRTGSELIDDLNAENLPPRTVRPGDRVPLTADVSIEVLGPKPGMDDANDRSLVTRLWVGRRTILFTGDIQTGGMRALIDRAGDLKSDILVAPHHGSSEDLTPTFVDTVAPDWIISSNDRTLTGKQKRFDTMMADRKVLRTNEYGAITILITRDGTVQVDGFVKHP